MRTFLILLAVVFLNTAYSFAFGGMTWGCINTLEDGSRHCFEVSSSSSCEGNGGTYGGLRIVDTEAADLKTYPRTRNRYCVGRNSGDTVDYNSRGSSQQNVRNSGGKSCVCVSEKRNGEHLSLRYGPQFVTEDDCFTFCQKKEGSRFVDGYEE